MTEPRRRSGPGAAPTGTPRPEPVQDDAGADYEAEARRRLPDYVSAYYATTAGGGDPMRDTRAWDSLVFRPRVLRDVSLIETRTTVLGTPVSTPVLVAPMAQQLGAHAEGEAAMARGVAAAGSLLAVSTNTAVPFADVAAAGAPWWFQVYLTRDRSLTERLVGRAVMAGAKALLLTVDMNALLPSSVNPRQWPEGPASTRLGNLTADERTRAGPDGVEVDRSITPDVIGWLGRLSGLPVLVKGVVRGDDARRCLDAGAAGLIVSTHGGRRLGPSVSAARALPEVVAAAGGAEVYVDSGLRRGEHVAAALALGARAVFVGRPALWALAAAGPDGVRTVVQTLTGELANLMLALGTPRIADLTPDLIGETA